jgi:hypothetical protein
MKEPVFLKESSNAENQLEKLKALEPFLNEEGQIIIRQDIKNLECGIFGEKNIAFELKNSHMPLYILHDIYLEDGDLSAQIDYLVFTKKLCFVIECKNLFGNIEINSSGDFIRTMELGNKKVKEGLYSPITQNQRHLELMKKIKYDNKKNIITKFIVGRYFEDYSKSIVVLANPKTVLNAKFAKKEVKDKVIRADQLVKYIKDMYEKSNEMVESEERMLDWARSYMELHKEVEKDYTAKYDRYMINTIVTDSIEITQVTQVIDNIAVSTSEIPIEATEIFKELKIYRLSKSREERIKPYYIYNDNQLKDLIIKMPSDKEQLRNVAGFSEIKANKYGDEIINIIKKHIRK